MYHYYFSEQDTERGTQHRTGVARGVPDTRNRRDSRTNASFMFIGTHTTVSSHSMTRPRRYFVRNFLSSPSKHEMLHLEMPRLNTLGKHSIDVVEYTISSVSAFMSCDFKRNGISQPFYPPTCIPWAGVEQLRRWSKALNGNSRVTLPFWTRSGSLDTLTD